MADADPSRSGMLNPTRQYRPLIMGRRGAVGTNHPLATQAGLDVLRGGGNAVDAAVAVSLALGGRRAGNVGLGGDGFYQCFDAFSGEAQCFNGTGAAPLAAIGPSFTARVPVEGPLSVSVPGALAGIGAMHRDYGRLPWADLCGPAIDYARQGFASTHNFLRFVQDRKRVVLADNRTRATFLSGSKAELPALGAIIKQTDLASTLEMIAGDGYETFYHGALARRLTSAFAEVGVIVSQEDLDACVALQVKPLSITYRGYVVTQTPPNSTGFTLLQMLKIAEQFSLKDLDQANLIHLLVETTFAVSTCPPPAT